AIFAPFGYAQGAKILALRLCIGIGLEVICELPEKLCEIDRPFDFAQCKPSAPLRDRSLHFTSTSLREDTSDTNRASPSTSLRVRKIRPLSEVETRIFPTNSSILRQ
ncbi:MAG: hypothetical protein KBF32_02815, partial [Chitinophagales bacterium]|nr:hypothetical protein [Chitinophagales bacterium]